MKKDAKKAGSTLQGWCDVIKEQGEQDRKRHEDFVKNATTTDLHEMAELYLRGSIEPIRMRFTLKGESKFTEDEVVDAMKVVMEDLWLTTTLES